MTLWVGGEEFERLSEVQRWARRAGRDSVTVEAHGVIEEPGCSWSYPCDLTIIGGTWVGDGAPGWWLSYRAPATLTLRGGVTRGYLKGGVDHGTQSGSASRLVAEGWAFRDLGGGPGYAAIYATDAEVTVRGCKFVDVRQDPNGQLLHAVYALRSQVTVSGCLTRRVSGDPLRARDGTMMSVSNHVNRRSGVTAVVSAWRRDGEAESALSVRTVDVGRVFDGSKRALPEVVLR